MADVLITIFSIIGALALAAVIYAIWEDRKRSSKSRLDPHKLSEEANRAESRRERGKDDALYENHLFELKLRSNQGR